MASQDADRLARKIWDYHHMNHRLEKADAIFILGSHDLRVADYGARLFLEGYAPLMIFSGGIAHHHDLLGTEWDLPESEMFARRAMELGVPRDKIITEDKATNTGENVQFTEKILEERGLGLESVIVVQKPYMERRAFATIKVYWPDKKIMITSPPIDFDDYPNEEISKDDVINLMVGDLQRIKVYPEKGFQTRQEIPADVWEAYQELVRLGYTKHLLKQA